MMHSTDTSQASVIQTIQIQCKSIYMLNISISYGNYAF